MKFPLLGDLVIVLKNPDHEKVSKKAVSLTEALRLYDKVICIDTKVNLLKNKNDFVLGGRKCIGKKINAGCLYSFFFNAG